VKIKSYADGLLVEVGRVGWVIRGRPVRGLLLGVEHIRSPFRDDSFNDLFHLNMIIWRFVVRRSYVLAPETKP
jgi:hypothetical protein